ncbi:MAG: hypothetical protein R3E39_18035 [Anaerolineae bacterium]
MDNLLQPVLFGVAGWFIIRRCCWGAGVRRRMNPAAKATKPHKRGWDYRIAEWTTCFSRFYSGQPDGLSSGGVATFIQTNC